MHLGWFTADEGYGDTPGLNLEDHASSYVMAVSCDHRFATPAGTVMADGVNPDDLAILGQLNRPHHDRHASNRASTGGRVAARSHIPAGRYANGPGGQ